jgi:precorrin-4 methylase
MQTGRSKVEFLRNHTWKQFKRTVSLISILILICSLGIYLNINPLQTAANDLMLSRYSADTPPIQINLTNIQNRILDGIKIKKSVHLRDALRQTRISIISDQFTQTSYIESIKSIFYEKFLQVYLYVDRPPPSLI